MNSFLPVALCSLVLLTGCPRYKKAVWASPEEAAKVKFPNSLEGGTKLSAPMMAALAVAMSDFLPPGSRPQNGNDPVERCLYRWDTFDASVLQVNENLFFVSFAANLSKCAPGAIVLDAGALYAIDGQGRILARE